MTSNLGRLSLALLGACVLSATSLVTAGSAAAIGYDPEAPAHSGFTVSPPTKPYLMAFHTCSTTSNCEDPTNHTIRIAESSNGADWTDVSGWQGYRGSVPDVIRRENTIYVIGAGLSRIDVTTGQVTADSFSVSRTDGSPSLARDPAFAGQLTDGRLIVVYVPSMQEVEGKTSIPVKLGTEVVDSNGSSFVEYGTAVDVPLDIAGVHGMASDPDIFFNGTEWVLYVSMGSNVVSFTAPAVTGPYSVASVTVVSQGAGGVPSAMVGTDGVWVYVNDGLSRDSIYIRRAVTTTGTSKIPASSFQTVLTGTPYGATTAESPGVAPNTEGSPCLDGCKTIAPVVAAPGQVRSAKVGRSTSSTATLTWRAPTTDGGGAITAYETRLKVAGGKWSAWGSQSATSSTGTFSKKWTGLKAAKGYTAQVRAQNSAGTGASTSVTFRTAKKSGAEHHLAKYIFFL